jgi:hypothetical protein
MATAEDADTERHQQQSADMYNSEHDLRALGDPAALLQPLRNLGRDISSAGATDDDNLFHDALGSPTQPSDQAPLQPLQLQQPLIVPCYEEHARGAPTAMSVPTAEDDEGDVITAPSDAVAEVVAGGSAGGGSGSGAKKKNKKKKKGGAAASGSSAALNASAVGDNGGAGNDDAHRELDQAPQAAALPPPPRPPSPPPATLAEGAAAAADEGTVAGLTKAQLKRRARKAAAAKRVRGCVCAWHMIQVCFHRHWENGISLPPPPTTLQVYTPKVTLSPAARQSC